MADQSITLKATMLHQTDTCTTFLYAIKDTKSKVKVNQYRTTVYKLKPQSH